MAFGSIWRAPWPASSYEVDRLGAFFDIIHQDPVLSQVKLIAEPWDRRSGRLSGGQFPGLVERMERQIPRHRTAVLEGRWGHTIRICHPSERQ